MSVELCIFLEYTYPFLYRITIVCSFIQVDENMHRAQMRDAAIKQKFFFRKHMAPILQTVSEAAGSTSSSSHSAASLSADSASSSADSASSSPSSPTHLPPTGAAVSDAGDDVVHSKLGVAAAAVVAADTTKAENTSCGCGVAPAVVVEPSCLVRLH